MQKKSAVKHNWLWHVAAATLVLNLIDCIFTLAVVTAGLATEANPLMDVSLSWGTSFFVAIKLSLVSLGVGLLWRLRGRVSAVFGLVLMAGVYIAIATHHLQSVKALAELVTTGSIS